MADDGNLRRPRYGPSTSTALSPVVIDVTPAAGARPPGVLSFAWVIVLAATAGFVVASLAVGARNGGHASFARLWLPTPLAEAPAPVAVADVAPQPRSQELPVPERPAPPVVVAPSGPVGPFGEPLPNPADFAAADALPVIPAPAEPPPALPTAVEFEQWVGRQTTDAAPAARQVRRPPAASPARTPAPPPAFRTGLPPPVIAHSEPAAPPATAASTGGQTLQLPTLPPPRPVARSVPIPPQPPGTQVASASRAAAAGVNATWTRYARPFEASEQRPRIAVIVTELGLSQAMTDQAIQFLPGAVTLAFNPYSESLDRWVESARGAGHEVLINLPMEPTNFPASDPGPQALMTNLSAQQNLARLDWVLGRFAGYVGVAGIQGGRFVASAESMQPVMANLRDRGVIYVEKTVGTPSTAPRLARELGVPRASTDRWIDLDPSRGAIDQRLSEVERLARDNGVAVAVAQPLPVTYERLAIWQTTLPGKSLVLAPVSAVIDRQRDR